MEQNHKYYIIWPLDQPTLPSGKAAAKQVDFVNLIRNKAPHLLIPEKRSLSNTSLSMVSLLISKKEYPFKNGQQAHTKGSVVWTDYAIYFWQLVLYLLKTHPAIGLEELLRTCFHADSHQPNQQSIETLMATYGTHSPIIETDELDRWYDEISLTHLSPQSYHQLYRWFGIELKAIGYQAFDHFMNQRDGIKAWQQAIQQYLSDIDNLPDDIASSIFDDYLQALLTEH
ncbi:hypothetical protein KEM09_01080 [Carboxylicivirga mesophila]|uniref:Uncharacterized protein n=1 Tax=Carboxylicivirga mesophila TaxID=1166478 RepID=A0ABS5K4P1_9BACT|nr:hypothetical protein [Carboxylicivirga mesophila]MBS2209977.1 hypothetical protein [Carboxylicivirga mesophila]